MFLLLKGEIETECFSRCTDSAAKKEIEVAVHSEYVPCQNW